MATDLLARIRVELDERLLALRPLLSEYERLLAAAETLAAVAAEPAPAPLGRPAEVAPIAPEPSAQEPHGGPRAQDPSTREPSAQEPSGTATSAGEPAAGGPAPGESTAGEPAVGRPAAGMPTAQEPIAGSPTRESTVKVAPGTRDRPRGRPPRGSAAGTFGLAMSLRTTPPIHPIARTPTARSGEPPASKRVGSEALEWLTPMPGAPSGDEHTTIARGGAGGEQATSASPVEETVRRREPVSPADAQQAILAALEHGSHTPGELVMVTAMSPTEIRGNLGRLARRGAVAKVKRDGDGKAAYALPSVSARV